MEKCEGSYEECRNTTEIERLRGALREAERSLHAIHDRHFLPIDANRDLQTVSDAEAASIAILSVLPEST